MNFKFLKEKYKFKISNFEKKTHFNVNIRSLQKLYKKFLIYLKYNIHKYTEVYTNILNTCDCILYVKDEK